MAVVLLCAFWGMAFNITFQSEIITYAPSAASSVAIPESIILESEAGHGLEEVFVPICPFPISELLVA